MKKTYLILIVLIAISGITRAQVASLVEKPNIIKFNLTGPVFGNYTLQYERVLKANQSIGMSIGFAPEQDLPFKAALLNLVGDDPQAEAAIENTLFNTITIQPEYRFYSGIAGAPIGFYAATFLRYTNMQTSGQYLFNLSDGEHNPFIEMKINGFGVGEMIGIQWALGKSMTLDWWIFGPFIGIMKGTGNGLDDRPISDPDKIDLEADIEEVGNAIPGWTVDATVTDDASTGNGYVDVTLDGLFYGARFMGVCLGIRF